MDLERAMSEEQSKRREQESEAIRKFYETHPNWSLLQVANCPTPGCGKPLHCKVHRYAYRKWWVNLRIGLKG
jgi:hypothetical protein